MKRWILVFFCLLTAQSMATHIVGGEFEMIYKRTDLNGNHRYNISLILYFDLLNGDPGARDPLVRVRIFRKSDNAIMVGDLLLNVFSTRVVEYFQPECSNGTSISTDRIYYTYMVGGQQGEYSLSPDVYNDPEGYYIAWERCCRNYGLTNAFSENPLGVGSIYAGQTFYLEFPALMRNGEPFINSSPTLFPPLSDYACPGRLYYVDFGGTDPDGDSLVYSMITPLNTWTREALPLPELLPAPGPYPPIRWQTGAGFSEERMMLGNPDLQISTDGLITVVPSFAGLYVFAVKCEEFRNGEKIGEVRRDFQMLVLAGCPQAQKPIVEAKPVGAPDTEYKPDKLNVTFSNVVDDEVRCVVVRVFDPDSQSADDGNREDVSVRAIPLGFKSKKVNEILPDITKATLTNGSTAEFNICFPKCPYILGPYKIGIIVSDNACPLPLMDTIVVTVDVQLPPNNLPYFDPAGITQTVREGSGVVTWDIAGVDADLDKLTLKELPSPLFNLADYGFAWVLTSDVDGRIEAELSWNTRCDEVDFSERINFPIRFTLNDVDECDLLPPDTLKVNLTMDLYDFHNPIIEYAPDPTKEEVTLTHKIFETVNFNVLGSDEDNEKLILTGKGEGFNMQTYGVTFPGDTDIGNVASPFAWNISCDVIDLDLKDEFKFEFIVIDSTNRCHYYLADTLHVTVNVEPALNTQPNLSVNGSFDDPELSYTIGQPIVLNVVGADTDVSPTDLLKLELIDAEGDILPEGYSFEPREGYGTVQSTFSWNPGCEIYENADYENGYIFAFRVTDDRCFNILGDTVEVAVTIKDAESYDGEFLPNNFITPNGDGCNDFFAVDNYGEGTDKCPILNAPNLPKDNCAGRFLAIRIYNRWGREVYSSADRNFRWYADDQAVGVYFYYMTYSEKEYKGTISVSY